MAIPLVDILVSLSVLVVSISTQNLVCDVDPLIPIGWHYHPHSSSLNKSPLHCDSSVLGLIGDVTDVINGVVTEQTENTFWTGETSGSFGFGAGAIGSLSGLGEAIFANNIAIVRNTDNGSVEYFQTVTGTTFRTSFSLVVQKGAEADAKILVNLPSPQNFSLNDLYTKLNTYVDNSPFCFYGLVQFSELEGIAVSKAPIYGEPLFGEVQEGYYTQPGFHLSDQHAMIFGCAADFNEISDPELLRLLSKLLYVNPHDKRNFNSTSPVLNVHSHAVSLKKCLKSPDQIDLSSVQDVFHMLSNSTMTFLDASVFILNSTDKLVEIFPNSPIVVDSSKTNEGHSSKRETHESKNIGHKDVPEFLFMISIILISSNFNFN